MYRKIHSRVYAALILAVISINCYSQDQTSVTTRDLELWTSGEIKFKPNDKWTFGLEEQVRLNDNMSQIDQFFTELSVKKDFTKSLYWGIGTRYIRFNDVTGNKQGYENHIRYNVDLGYNQKISRWKLNYQLRFQTKNELGVSEAEGDEAKNHLRFKFSTDYNINNWKLDPKFSAEIFNDMGGIDSFDKYRITIGTSYKIKRLGEIDLFYRMERELNVSYPLTSNIIGLKYCYTIKNKK